MPFARLAAAALLAGCATTPTSDAPDPGSLPRGEGVTRPQITESDMDELYAFAGSNNLTGMVQLRCVVTVAGDLTRCRVEKPVLPSELDLKVAQVIERKWKARPATMRGEPVEVDFVLHLRFSPERPPPPTPVAPPN